LSPLAIAAYVAWVVVWLTATASIAARAPDMLIPARAALLIFLLGFALTTHSHLQLGWRPRSGLFAAMTMAALFLIYLHPFGTGSILMVLLAAVLAVHLAARPLLLYLVGINGIVMLIMATRTDANWSQVLLTVLSYSSLQAFASLVIRNTQRAEQMADDLRAANAELMTTRLLLAESARDQERLRLSRELHDVAGHGLTALKLNLGVLARDARQPDPERIGVCAKLADELLQNLRSVVQQLRADPGLDLRATLQRIALPFPRPTLELELAAELPPLSFRQIEVVMRAVQEALTNAARHGNARTLRVSLGYADPELRLRIEDDGRAPPRIQFGGGLSGMRERIEELGGTLAVSTAGMGGLSLQASLPLNSHGAAG
jgi:signal transduction histidine kinase